ncbi:endonuclease/exonuclease/phosphatase family protein [Streptomyces ipomoeae]|jgi:vancomycin resistance protein VanJ|uniref:Endonuclease/exonuclease/phosphatase family protein n=1 Tax=Streptomyces ipomoeae 91-03 TaxID=698759 RepID=L1KPZ1_9ACTN|nr:endonuclease/exonuclease/phosphatase family protein [Streptomyces ipomoeae]EKX62438.1 endonuclease/exonuclease/phosphatase family protein [Streptomyces ipomoeae 91-03]MDX2698855.1 endonuclease/exonuclease/phosphatase family protein [Streptomyces ipomoeae]MDX2826217.1 endonuclease/exonuclease/phosphatase family protein [Streptomyces ipomoeae]MDX2844488.1 endonuclease/exonuclease/phosphatase family protein [Streptomyces ipomoeae]MDX2878878.1 endonuclease/exonuclease/phosphatase family protein
MAQAYMTETGGGGTGQGREGSRLRRLFGRLFGGWRGDRRIWRRGIVVAVLALLLALVMVLHAQIPNAVGNLGSLTETFLPWLGVVIPLLLLLALVRKSATALIAVLVPTIVWLNMFGGLVTSKTGSGGDLMVVTHNVNADNADPSGTARDVAASGADVVALEELSENAVPVYEKALAPTYKYHKVVGTVGLWSKYPMSATKAVDIKLGWERAMRSTVTTPEGPVAVYVAHLPSVRVKLEAGFTARQRDKSANALGEAIAAEPIQQVVLLGDLNGTMNDRALNAVTAQMRSTQGAAGNGFGFSWPASFPMARIDQIMVRGMEPMASWNLPETGSDHLPVAARVTIDTSTG